MNKNKLKIWIIPYNKSDRKIIYHPYIVLNLKTLEYQIYNVYDFSTGLFKDQNKIDKFAHINHTDSGYISDGYYQYISKNFLIKNGKEENSNELFNFELFNKSNLTNNFSVCFPASQAT